VIAGSINKDMGSYIQQRFNELKNVAFLGQIADLNRFFRKSHVCIVPSLLDAGPTTVSEAMICGLPVIVSDGCGAKTLVKEGENGFVVPSRNSKVIADKIDWFCRNQSAIPQMGNNAANTIKVLAKSDQNKIAAEHILKVIAQLKRENRQ
jgi:glycosyltransferase involved in cell wall biosynthesis